MYTYCPLHRQSCGTIDHQNVAVCRLRFYRSISLCLRDDSDIEVASELRAWLQLYHATVDTSPTPSLSSRRQDYLSEMED